MMGSSLPARSLGEGGTLETMEAEESLDINLLKV